MRHLLLCAAVCAAALAQAPKPVPSWRDLKYPPLRPIQIPPVATYTLPNGMKLFLLEDHELPIVSGAARVRTGNLFDPPGKVGLATMTGVVMRSGGTRDRTGDQVDEMLENIAASVESSIGETSGSVSFSTLKEKTGDVLAVFHDILTAPEFRPDKIELARSQLRSGISRRNDDPHGIVQREFGSLVYGPDTPYGWELEYATVDAVKRDDIVAFYRRYFFPANVLLAVWGDFDTAEMKARIERLFADWTYRQPPVPAFPAVKSKPAPGIYLATKEDVTQTFFSLGHLGGELRDKDFPALEVACDILGGGFRSRLMERVRTKMGAAYDISAYWGADYDHPGLFTISGSTKSLSTAETLKAVREEVERIRNAEVSAGELQTAKETALNSLVFAFDTKAKTLGRLLTYEYYGYPRDFIQQYQKALAAVTRADVLRVAKEHILPQNMTIVAVGNPRDFGQPLTSLGLPVKPLDLTIPEPKAVPAKADTASIEKGRALLARVQQAVGGAEKLSGVKDVTEEAEYQIDPAAGGMRVQQTDRWVAPEHFRQDSVLPMGKIAAYSDGRTGWIVTPQGSGQLSGAQLKQVQGDLFRFYFRLLLSDRIPGRTVSAAGDDAVEISDASGESARLVVDPQTGMPQNVIYQSVHVAGPPVAVEDQYAAFQEVSGIRVPSRIVIMQGGHKFAEVSVKDYRINTGLNVEELSRRP